MNRDLVKEYGNVWGDAPENLLKNYDFQIELTKKLDDLHPENLNRETFYEIVLWKLNRFPQIEDELLRDLKAAAQIEPKEHRKIQPVLRRLLMCQGIGLPMASTVLRFLNPQTFQIIDDRVHRVVYGLRAGYPQKPAQVTERFLDTSEIIYFNYLDELHRLSSERLPFSSSDRILYELDKKLGYKIGDNTAA